MKERRLHPLIRLAEERESVVARALAERKRTLDSQQERLDELQRYAEEYSQPVQGSTHPAMLANRLAFRERIKQAVDTQHRNVETVRSHCEVETARLLIASRETQVLEKLAASYRRQEDLEKARREQREQDEIAARRKSEE
ncbi:MAG TPA: flagellar export protein FliJ [Arenimonas sp.]|nr:flagellar export protein FliJ [Arenimonas sp.]